MAINWSAGLISAGKSMKQYSAMLLKEEYMQEEREIAASTASAKRLEFLYEELGKEARNLNDALSRTGVFGGMGELADVDQKNFRAQLEAINGFRGSLLGVLSGVSPSSSVSDDLLKQIQEALEKARGSTANIQKSGEPKSERPSDHPSGDKRIGNVKVADQIDEQIRLISSLLVGFDMDLEEGSVISWLKENFPTQVDAILGEEAVRYGVLEKAIGIARKHKEKESAITTKEAVDEEIIRGGEHPIESAKIEPTLPGPRGRPRRTITVPAEQVPDDIDPNNLPEGVSIDEDGKLTITITEGEEAGVPASGSQAAEQKPLLLMDHWLRTGQEITPPDLPGTDFYGTPPGLIEQGESADEAVPGQESIERIPVGSYELNSPYFNWQETPGGGISEEPQLELETVDGIPQTGIGSDAAIRSLYEDVGGPIGEPTGNVVYPTNIPKESEEIETKKASLNRTLGALVKYAESNVNGYNAVEDSTEGDANLTNMTLREIREKHGNKAVGVGQFKYDEFIKPTADKYMNIDEETLLSTVFSRDFQEQLLTLGLEDAGMTLFLKGRIDEETFMKRLWNIFRGLAPTKESLPGEVTDEHGNKVNVGGGLISQALERY